MRIFSKFKLIEDYRDEDIQLFVYASDKKSPLVVKTGILKSLLRRIARTEEVKQFSKIDIMIVDKRNTSNHDENVDGFVITKEVKQGLPRIYIREDIIYQGFEGDRPETHSKKFEDKIFGVCVHEITHLWHHSLVSYDDIGNRYRHLVNKAQANIEKNLGFGPLDITISILSDVRKGMILFMEQLSSEGIAEYTRFLSTKKYNLTRESVKQSYSRAYQEAKMLNKALGSVYKLWFGIVNVFPAVVPALFDKKVDDKTKQAARKYHSETFDIYLNPDNLNCISQFAYVIGPHLFHTISYVEGTDIRTLARLRPKKLIETYEKACHKLRWQPVISYRNNSGVFNYITHKRLSAEFRRKIKKEWDRYREIERKTV